MFKYMQLLGKLKYIFLNLLENPTKQEKTSHIENSMERKPENVAEKALGREEMSGIKQETFNLKDK